MSDPKKTPEPLIYDQIETTAGYNPPGIYSLLTHFDSLKTKFDPEAANYIPLTTVNTDTHHFLPFIVGLLPPATTTKKRILDRSASAIARTATVEPPPSPTAGVPEGGSGEVPYAGGPTVAPPGSDFWVQYVAMSNRLKVDPTELAQVLYCESALDPKRMAWLDADNKPCKADSGGTCEPFAKGLNQLVQDTAMGPIGKDGKRHGGLGMDQATWDNFQNMSREEQLPWVEKFMQGAKIAQKSAAYIYGQNFAPAGINNPKDDRGSTVLYASKAYMDANGGPAAFKTYRQGPSALKANPSLGGRKGYITIEDMGKSIKRYPLPKGYVNDIEGAKRKLGMQSPNTIPVPPVTTFDEAAAAAAWAAKKEQEIRAGKDLPAQEFERQLRKAQQEQIDATNEEIDRMARTPPLKMLVSPTSFKFSAEKIVADGNWSRSGPIIEHWGNQQEKIEGSGKLAAFYALDAQGALNGGGSAGNSPGLTRTARAFSMSYQNFLSLYMLYKNNGGIWLDDYFSNAHSNTKRVSLSLVGAVYIYYDSTLYVGSFDNFTITESDAAPFTLEYSFSFTVRSWFLLDRKDWWEKKLPTNNIPTRQGRAEREEQASQLNTQLETEAFNQKAAKEAALVDAAAAFAEGGAKFDAQYLAPPPDLPPPAKTIPTHTKNR